MVETAAAEKLWAMLVANGPGPAAIDWLREEYDWLGAPDFKGASFRDALRDVAAEWLILGGHPQEETPEKRRSTVSYSTVRSGTWAAGRGHVAYLLEEAERRPYLNWTPYVARYKLVVGLMEYVESLP
jgi:hypothetical protein